MCRVVLRTLLPDEFESLVFPSTFLYLQASHMLLHYFISQFKDACPPHKIKDLDMLVKRLNGDENKIRTQIAEWWEGDEW